ncbi:MAG: helix-turn-helix transcriptional regulator [Oscillospiraceae bacterium]
MGKLYQLYITQWRGYKKITLRQLSEMTGITKTRINDIERGAISPKLDDLCLIAEALELNTAQLFTCYTAFKS